jgi:hypothetical protein
LGILATGYDELNRELKHRNKILLIKL